MRKALFALVIASSSSAAAGPQVELGVAAGGHAFASDVELGVDDDMSLPGPQAGAAFGLRIAVPVVKRLAVEGEALLIPTKDDVLGDSATVFGLRAHARFDLLTGRLKPFVVAGTGAHVLRATSAQMTNDADREYHWGGGFRFALSDKLEARIDARHLIVPDRTLDGATSDFEITAGATFRFGGAKPAVRPVVVVEEPPPPAPKVEPVPEPTPEPVKIDPDPDRDGILGQRDVCPDDAETKNGFRDEDGCPDQVIDELTGIGFERESARIDVDSTPLLERAYEILQEYPGLSVEISGHTSSEGKYDRNQDLSLRRAEAVKAYLVKRGIPAERILTVGHGPDVPKADNATEEGRRKNRRIEFRILTPDELMN